MPDINSSSSAAMPLDARLANSQSKTEFKVVKFSHVWTIENYSFCGTEVGECLKSPTFSANPNDEKQPKWHLELYPNGSKGESRDYVGLYVRLLPNKTTEPVIAKFKFAILKANSEHANVMGPGEAYKFGPENWAWGWNKIIRRDFLLDPKNGLLPDDRLSIFCEVSMVVDKVDVIAQSGCSVPQIRLFDDMGAMLEKGLFADFVLYSGDKEFKVHKNVLACRSPVFAAMFEHAMEESRTNKVNIEDISAPVLGQLLHFLYTGCEPKLLAEQDMAEGLLAAADKYQLDRLKTICEQRLSTGLNKDNICATLALADLHSAEHLKSLAIEYIKLHAEEVMETDGWRTFVSSHPEMLAQLFKLAIGAKHKSQAS